MFVLHADCNNVWSKCRYCSESATNDDQTSDSHQQPQQPSEPSTESVVNSSADTGDPRNIAGDVKTPDEQQPILLSTTSSSNNESINTVNVEASRTDLPAEKMEQRKIETISQDDHILEEEATVVNAAATSIISQQGDDGVIVVAEPKNDQFPDPDGIEEKSEGQLKEEKDPVMGADLILLDFDISLIHNQSRVEALLLCNTFIGPAYRSSSKDDVSIMDDDTVFNVEYQGDNIIGCFNCNGNHAFESSGGQRRLYGAVYSVRKYQQSVDIETVYAVIIWIDAAVKDKAEIEITSFDDYFELLKLS